LSSAPRDARDSLFWDLFPSLLPRDAGAHTTPRLLASLLIRLLRPAPTDRVLDPACGTGLLLVEALRHLHWRPGAPGPQLFGVELNDEVAALAETNLMLAGIPPGRIFVADSLSLGYLGTSEIRRGSFDCIATNPPIGRRSHRAYLADLELAGLSFITREALFIERSLSLLRPGGKAAVLVPDSLLSNPNLLHARRWILSRSTLRAIVGLPASLMAFAGYSGRASILLLEKRVPTDSDPVLLALLDSVAEGPETELNLLRRVESIADELQARRPEAGPDNIWRVRVDELNLKRLDVPYWSSVHLKRTDAVRSPYPRAKLSDIAEIVSGRNVRTHVPPDPGTALLIQAGAVREFRLETSSSPHISREEYMSVPRAQLRPGDVLVTTTGQYLGRAAMVEELTASATISGAVTILRPKESVDPQYLAALLNSPVCRVQIEALQASSTAQPYIRRADLGEIIIPLPPLENQRRLAAEVTRLRNESRELMQRAQDLEEKAKRAVLDALEADGRE